MKKTIERRIERLEQQQAGMYGAGDSRQKLYDRIVLLQEHDSARVAVVLQQIQEMKA